MSVMWYGQRLCGCLLGWVRDGEDDDPEFRKKILELRQKIDECEGAELRRGMADDVVRMPLKCRNHRREGT